MVSQAERASRTIARASWIGFWIQVVLAVVATAILLFAVPMAAGGQQQPTTPTPETGAGATLSGLALLVLYASLVQTFRYTRIARQLRRPDSTARPSRRDTRGALQWGMRINLVGLGISLMGAEAIAGSLLAKAVMQPNAFNIAAFDPSKFVQALDIFVVLANTHTSFAHFAGLAVSLFLVDRVNAKP